MSFKAATTALLCAGAVLSCIGRELPPPSPADDQGPLFFGPRDGGTFTFDGGSGGGRPRGPGGGGATPDAGAPDGGIDPYCTRPAEPMTFSMTVATIGQDYVAEGPVSSVDRETLVISSSSGPQTLRWTLPSQATPSVGVGQFVRLLYRPYEIGTYQSASITLRDEHGTLLFVGETGLHSARIVGEDLQVASVSVADRGCKLFPIRCREPRNLDLLLTDSAGTELRVPPGDKATFAYQGRQYEVINVNTAELAYIECNVIPARYRSYVIQLVPGPL